MGLAEEEEKKVEKAEEKTEFKLVKVAGKERKVLVLAKKGDAEPTPSEEKLQKEKEALTKYEKALKDKSKREGEEIEEDFPVIELTELMADMRLEEKESEEDY